MAGKGQHYIPRFLLNGFASRTQGKESFVWYFRQGSLPFENNTRKVGKEKEFYGEPDNSLDKFITNELETKQSDCLARIRRDRVITSPADGKTLLDFMHSLVLRTKHMRDMIEKGTHEIFNQARQTFTNVDATRRLILNLEKRDKLKWDGMLTRYIRAKYGVQNSQREKYLKWQKKPEFKQWILHTSAAEEIFQQFATFLKYQFPQLLEENLGAITKATHVEGLQKALQPDIEVDSPRYARYLQMRWKVQSLDKGSLILGDVAVLQFEQKTTNFSAGLDGIDGDVILLPLSHDLLLMGTLEGEDPLISPDEINRHSAVLSIDYFVSSKNSDQEKAYQALLGSRALQFPKVF